jgi:chemotaxis protein MotB
MTATIEPRRPIIVKRYVTHDDEHGGQWKVAYADFVTAMMAFFLIMWLLSSATSNDRVIIAKYFTSTSVFDLPAGNGVLSGGKSVMEGSDAKPVRGAPANKDAKAAQEKAKDAKDTVAPAQQRSEHQRFEALKAEMDQMMHSGELKGVASNIEVALTSDGLRIQIFDRDGEPMFAPGGIEPLPRLKSILVVIAEVLGTVQNAIVLSGHTDGQALQRSNYSNWELSADRANAVRRTLESDGLPPGRIVQVEGRAASDPLLPQSPLDPRNRRIAVTILRSDLGTTGSLPATHSVQPPTPN